ncbi:MAG: transposase, partial [Pseudomonadota bacterium]
LLLDSSHAKAHRCADVAYDSDGLRRFLARCTTEPVIKPNPTRKRPAPYDRAAFRARNAIARMFSQLKDWRRVATRYDKLKETYSATVQLAATVLFRL